MSRYADRLLDALMYSHTINLKCELYYGNTYVRELSLLGGSVTADRSGTTRRTATIDVDPNHLNDPAVADYLKPYGSRIRLSRGVRYPDGENDLVQVFWGRIDAIDTAINKVSLRCSDLNADIADARFIDTMSPSRLPGAPTTIVECIKALVAGVFPATPPLEWDTTGITSTGLAQKVAVGTVWSQERADALDSLATQLQGGCEWYMDCLGKAHIHPLPAVPLAGVTPAWIIDSGDEGVLVERVTSLDRAKVFNGCQVTGEPVGGKLPAVGKYMHPDGPMAWGGAFGKVVAFYTGQQLDPNTTAGADALAKTLTLNAISGASSVQVTCVPNPKLKLGDVVRVYSPPAKVDGNYYVQAFTLPMDPDTAMTMTLYTSLAVAPSGAVTDAEPSIPRGATWEPGR